MFIPDPGSGFVPILDPGSRIPDIGSRIQPKEEVIFFYLFNFLPTKYELGAYDLRVYDLREYDLTNPNPYKFESGFEIVQIGKAGTKSA